MKHFVPLLTIILTINTNITYSSDSSTPPRIVCPQINEKYKNHKEGFLISLMFELDHPERIIKILESLNIENLSDLGTYNSVPQLNHYVQRELTQRAR